MEKKTSFMSLVYREYCITKKSAFGVVTVVMGYGICIMYALSAKFGNIAKINGAAELTKPMVHIMGIMFSFMLFMVSIDGSVADLRNKTWALYRKSSPIRPLRLAMARVIYQLAAFLISVGVSFLYLLTDSLISEKGIAKEDIGIVTVISAVIVLMGVSMTVCVEFMRSTDKGMLLAMGVIFAVVIPNKERFASGVSTMEELQAMLASLTHGAPIFYTAIMFLFAAEAVLLALLYKRRDK